MGTGEDEVRYLVKVRGQVKLGMVEKLMGGVDLDGEYVIGQLTKDNLRARRGAWHFHGMRIDKSQLIQDRRYTKLVTFGSREYTEAERKVLQSEGFRPEHITHDIAYDDFYRWTRRLIQLLRIRPPTAK